MAYTTIDRSTDYFRVKTYSGSSSDGNAVTWDETDNNMQPDWLWLKNRTAAQEHWLADSVRGTGKFLESNSTNAESSDGASGLASFDTNGFTLNDSARTNRNTMVGWGWKAGTSFTNDASATGIGTIDSTGSVNDAAGFSIISFTGTGANGTIKHGLSTAPRAMIFKNRDEGAEGWFVYHESLGNTKKLLLDSNSASSTSSTFFQDTSPTSSIITLGSNHGCNGPDAMICYAFAEKKGYSKFGSYTGNGNANGPLIYTGFKPAWFMVKKTNGADNWGLLDNKRNEFNLTNKALTPNSSGAEYTTNSPAVDFVANGFKIRESDGIINGSGDSYIFMCFAESPFVTSTGIPTTAK